MIETLTTFAAFAIYVGLIYILSKLVAGLLVFCGLTYIKKENIIRRMWIWGSGTNQRGYKDSVKLVEGWYKEFPWLRPSEHCVSILLTLLTVIHTYQHIF